MIKKLLSGVLVLTATTVFAQDLESLLEGKAATAGSGNQQEAAASNFHPMVNAIKSVLGKNPNSEQQVFFRHIEAQAWNKALIQFQPAFQNTDFSRGETGKALLGLLKFKSGLTVFGLEDLMVIQNPAKIHTEIAREWRTVLPVSHTAWDVAQIKWAPVWNDFFGHEFEYHVKAREANHQQKVKDLLDLASKTPADTFERAQVDWSLALAYSLNDQADLAAKVLAQILKNPKSPYSQDLIHLTAGRLLFQNGYFQPAIRYYEKIAKKSEFWLEAQEEIAWSYIRLAEPQNALAVSETLMNSAFVGLVGPETYFVRSLAQLKICQYPAVVNTLSAFPKNFKERTQELKVISESPEQKSVVKLLAQMKSKKVSWQDLGKEALHLPRYMNRDEKLYGFITAQAVLEKEAQAAESLYALSLAQTGLQSFFENMKSKSLARAEQAKSSTLARVKEIAANEVEETQKILTKLHIVEAEVIQQVDLSEKLIKTQVTEAKKQNGSTGSKVADVLVFPAEKEVWFDELSNYKMDVNKACQSLKR